MSNSVYEITNYTDYREYLRDRLSEAKLKNSKITLSYCAKKLGTTRGYLGLVASQKRHMSIDKTSLVAKLFEFTTIEKQFFLYLFLSNTVNDQELNQYFKTVLDTIRIRRHTANIPNTENREVSTISFLSRVVGCLSELADFEDNSVWIQKKLLAKYELNEIESALGEAKKAGELSRTKPSVGNSNATDLSRYRSYQAAFNELIRVFESPEKHQPKKMLLWVGSLTKEQHNNLSALQAKYIEEFVKALPSEPTKSEDARIFTHQLSLVPLTVGH